MSMELQIKTKLNKEFHVLHMEIENESYKHSVPKGSESHFKLLLVSDDFKDTSRVLRQKKVYALLAEELKTGLHALSLRLLTADEWNKDQKFTTPPCHGGSKRE